MLSPIAAQARLRPAWSMKSGWFANRPETVVSPGMGYRGIWVAFCGLWFVLGVLVAVYPLRVASFLARKDNLSPARRLTAWRIGGVVLAVGSSAKLFSVVTGQ